MGLKCLIFLFGMYASNSLAAAPPISRSGPPAVKHTKKEKGKKKSKDELDEEQSEADAEEERKRKAKLARILVLKWENTSTDYSNETVVRNVRSRISRPDAMFFPEVDLYQNGRKVRDTTVIPANQPAKVPDSNMPGVINAANATLSLAYNAMQPAQWGIRTQDLIELAENIWFVDRVELREPLFMLYVATGWAAENSNYPAPPFFEAFGPVTVNYYWYLAALLAYQEPSLMSKITNQDLVGSVGHYLRQLQQGAYPSFKLDFELEDRYDPEVFPQNYEVLINGLPVVLDNNAQLDGYLGRTDIYLKRVDTGHGMSERLETVKLDEKVYFVRETARKKMGIEFIDQLFLHKNSCIAEVDGDILNYLAIYQKIHPEAEVYIAVAEKGVANKVWIWRYVPDAAHLLLVYGGGDGFPVRFAFVFSSGAMFNGGALSYDTNVSDENTIDLSGNAVTTRFDSILENAFVPFNFEARIHYNRFMFNIGTEFGLNTREDNEWLERYHLPKHQGSTYPSAVKCNRTSLKKYGPITKAGCEETERFHLTHWNRYVYMGLGVVMGRDAGIGFGPRFQWRNGYSNLPHAWQSTVHFGWAVQPPIGDFGKRFRPLVDADIRAGTSYALRNSIQREIARSSDDESVVMPVFGLSLGLGFTF